jgi:hypothetical protein
MTAPRQWNVRKTNVLMMQMKKVCTTQVSIPDCYVAASFMTSKSQNLSTEDIRKIFVSFWAYKMNKSLSKFEQKRN